MTKQQIEKHGEVIKWFCDNVDKGVWCKFESCKTWELRYDPKFEVYTEYIENDVYAELRKAQADGKVIENSSTCGWIPLEGNIEGFKLSSLRIKPDEPKFKVGDWVRHLQPYDEVFQMTEQVLSDRNSDEFELWQPKEGEWCVFYNMLADGNFYWLDRFTEFRNEVPHGTGKNSANCIAPLEFAQTLKD